MDQVIKLAIKGGWKPRGAGTGENWSYEIALGGIFWKQNKRDIYSQPFTPFEVILFDPLFWQALSKAEGWGEGRKDKKNREFRKPCPNGCTDSYGDDNEICFVAWKYYRHQLIDHLDDGGTINSFFEDLLGKKK